FSPSPLLPIFPSSFPLLPFLLLPACFCPEWLINPHHEHARTRSPESLPLSRSIRHDHVRRRHGRLAQRLHRAVASGVALAGERGAALRDDLRSRDAESGFCLRIAGNATRVFAG